jgi:hypothetical protein
MFDEVVVLFEDTVDIEMDFPYWSADSLFYADDVVKYKHRYHYRALHDNKGRQPDISPNDWTSYGERSPYFFLRDTARTEDLVNLLESDHPYIRIYAFGALAKRKQDGLFEVLVENMADTTKIDFFTNGPRDPACPADLMFWSIRNDFSEQEIDSVKKLVVIKHSHLYTLETALRFHQPSDDQYKYVRAIVLRDRTRRSALVALSKYRREQDVQLIKSGFRFEDAPWVNDYFYEAIENFPHKDFENQLIAVSKNKHYRFPLGYDKRYLRALAMYKTKASLRVLEKYARRFMDANYSNKNYSEMQPAEKMESLLTIYLALKKNYTPMYDKLISEIIKKTGGAIEDVEKASGR